MLSDTHKDFLVARKISLSVAEAMGLYSGKLGPNGVDADPEGKVLVYPYMENGVAVNEKFRAPGKRFWQRKDGKKIFYNREAMTDPAVLDGTYPLVIVEGENDALAVMTADYPYVMSVPDGAPPARTPDGKLISVPDGTSDIDPEHDDKYSFILNDWELLAKVPRIVIATDADEPGQRLAKELVRRLDKIRCSFVSFPGGHKDFNEVLINFDEKMILDIIAAAKPYPISGVYTYQDLPPEPEIVGMATGFGNLDEYLRPYSGALMVITGLPGHGKSTFSTQLAANMAYLHGWCFGIASYEMRIKPYVTRQLKNSFIRMRNMYPEGSDANSTPDKFLDRRFCFIAPDPEDDIDHDLNWLIERMTTAVIRHGMRGCIIDPWNEIDHLKAKDESTTEYIGRALRKLKVFARRYDCLVIVVAHPDKSARHREAEDIGLIDISDSAHWANKADIGVTVGRIGDVRIGTTTGIYIKKTRYQPEAGGPGEAIMEFDRNVRLFVMQTE